jgi:hypothetical protein
MTARDQGELIPDLRSAANGDARGNQPHLILPRLLEKASKDYWPSAPEETAALDIIRKWADLERSGKLAARKETALQGEFLADIFGRVLGYTPFSKNLPRWELEASYGVNGGTADAALGLFSHGKKAKPCAMIELKGPLVNLDRDRSNGRTAVDQCFEYLIAQPECPWGIVCNYVSFRLYHRNKTKRTFEMFTLQELAAKDQRRFREFWVLFRRDSLLPVSAGQKPLLERLLEDTENRQREVGAELYGYYHVQRGELIALLTRAPYHKTLEEAIRIAQKLIDRIVFVAFCEDRDLLPSNSLDRAWRTLPPFKIATNPRWQNFLALFRTVDSGDPEQGITPFNGGLFDKDLALDTLDLPDKYTNFFRTIGEYDFRDEVNVDVLGHLFERSIHDIGRIRQTGVLELREPETTALKMEKSAERKRGGIYYTPPEFTKRIVDETVRPVIEAHLAVVARRRKLNLPKARLADSQQKELAKFWTECFQAVRTVKVCDPACGSGAFLIQAYNLFEEVYRELLGHKTFHEGIDRDPLEDDIPDIILRENLYGVDLSPQAVEITQLALWIRSARPRKSLADLSENIRQGNSLVTDPAVDPHALDWRAVFPEVFSEERGGFDCIIGNPPWERMKLQNREFFSDCAPDVLTASSPAESRKRIADLERSHPDLYARYLAAKESAEKALAHTRASGDFPLTGKGDINTYTLFAELARSLVAPTGRVGLLVPSGIATDHTTRDFFAELVDSKTLAALYDFENKAPIFPDVHRSYKFCVLLFGGAKVKFKETDFVFFAHTMDNLDDSDRHIRLSTDDMKLLNPNTQTCPIFRTRRDAELTKAIYRRIPILIDRTRKPIHNPWDIQFIRMFDQSNDAKLFYTARELSKMQFRHDGPVWKKGRKRFLSLYEAKMVQMYDHRAASVLVDRTNWMRQAQPQSTTVVQYQNPQFVAQPRWWVLEGEVSRVMANARNIAYLAYKDTTSATNQRTMIGAFVPHVAFTHPLPIVHVDHKYSMRYQCCLLANLNSLCYDFIARQKVGGVHLSFYLVEQIPTLPPDRYAARCPWDKRQTLEKWLSDRVLKLTCTADDMRPLAKAADFAEGVHPWNEEERLDLMAELDAAYFLLYGIDRSDVEYILSTFAYTQKAQSLLGPPVSIAEAVLACYDRFRGA